MTSRALKMRGLSAGTGPRPMTTSAVACYFTTVRTSMRSAQNGSPQKGSQVRQP